MLLHCLLNVPFDSLCVIRLSYKWERWTMNNINKYLQLDNNSDKTFKNNSCHTEVKSATIAHRFDKSFWSFQKCTGMRFQKINWMLSDTNMLAANEKLTGIFDAIVHPVWILKSNNLTGAEGLVLVWASSKKILYYLFISLWPDSGRQPFLPKAIKMHHLHVKMLPP